MSLREIEKDLFSTPMAPTIASQRQKILARHFPGGVPPLWCPTLTHYSSDGSLDHARMTAHFAHLSRWVKGFLIPGSTGDGWEMNDNEAQQLLEFALGQVQQLGVHLLIGILKINAAAAHQGIVGTLERLKARPPIIDPVAALQRAGVCGFTVCAPKGGHWSQEEIQSALSSILELGLPTAVYQLPQITQNEISAGVIGRLAEQFANFILFKDSSGADRVALAVPAGQGVFLVRGAEGDYARWLKVNGGPYDGLLLSTANCFARELQEMIDYLGQDQVEKAEAISRQLTAMVSEAFRLVMGIGDGNPFANANKAMDHFFGFGPRADRVPPPRLHAGSRLPEAVIRATGEALDRHGLMPKKGYLE
jgi:dihydrodipicolinate synthase/N-acetylneuraminate lyase